MKLSKYLTFKLQQFCFVYHSIYKLYGIFSKISEIYLLSFKNSILFLTIFVSFNFLVFNRNIIKRYFITFHIF